MEEHNPHNIHNNIPRTRLDHWMLSNYQNAARKLYKLESTYISTRN